MAKSRGKSGSCVCQTANPVALNGMNHRANAQVTAAVLITNGRCLILFLKSHSFTPPHTHSDIHKHTTKLYFALSLNPFAVGRRNQIFYAQSVKFLAHTVHGDCFVSHFQFTHQFTKQVFCNGCLVNKQYHSLGRH